MTGVPPSSRLLLWCCAPCLSYAATAVPTIGEPYLVWGQDGLHVRLRLDQPVAMPADLLLTMSGGATLAEVRSAWGYRRSVAGWVIPRRWFARGEAELTAPPRTWRIALPEVPDELTPTAIACTGTRRWLSTADLVRLRDQLGPSPSAVLLCDARYLATVLSSGGWETRLPILPLCAADETAQALLGPAWSGWRQGLNWGALAIVAPMREESVPAAFGVMHGPWVIGFLREAPWNLGLLALPQHEDPSAVTRTVLLAHAVGSPLVLAGGSDSGLVSEPMAASPSGTLVPTVGGTRYVLATPAGEGLTGLPPAVALGVVDPGVVGLSADDERLTMAICATGPALVYDWVRRLDDEIPAGGWGGGEAEPLLAQWEDGLTRASTSSVLAALEGLIAMERGRLAKAPFGVERWNRLIAPNPDATVTALHQRLAQRLSADEDWLASRSVTVDELPSWLRRDAVLRELMLARRVLRRWSNTVAYGDDTNLVEAVLWQARRHEDPEVLGVLMERLKRQSEGRQLIDADPWLQARLTATVFDSMRLSPSPLRPIANAILPRLDPLARGPVERFLARHGRFRSATEATATGR